MLLIHGVRPPHVRFRKQLADAVKAAHRVAKTAEPAAGLLQTSGCLTTILANKQVEYSS